MVAQIHSGSLSSCVNDARLHEHDFRTRTLTILHTTHAALLQHQWVASSNGAPPHHVDRSESSKCEELLSSPSCGPRLVQTLYKCSITLACPKYSSCLGRVR